ncbi:MAG TPA: molybdopterin molybdotransferase MoeA [Bacteroidales bacterium]|nr:molybdopterin molybdotransferase MoeA [Bacteroidales bacterium]HSA44130.1 molybdopterin molybdotransferase MoeA [Bacteroidales bacterium]
MITLSRALDIVCSHPLQTASEAIPLNECHLRVLAEDVSSDLDIPPFDKSAMDGFACRREDLTADLEVTEEIPAGKIPSGTIGKNQCARIMTGSMLPPGADCVIKLEDTATLPGGSIRFIASYTTDNICLKGEDVRKGDIVLNKGSLLKAPHLAVLASTGHVLPRVYRQPRICVLSTGDEIVEPDVTPAAAQIRNSNAGQLIAQAAAMGLKACYAGIAADEAHELKKKIEFALQDCELLLLTGGVSAGDYDLVPLILQQMGFDIHFHKIAVQPGNPTLFAGSQNKRVFGLPGNPVSAFVQFEYLVKPMLYASMGHHYRALIQPMPFGNTFRRRNAGRTALIPVITAEGKAWPVEYHGSAHIHAYVHATGIVELETGKTSIETGETVDVRFL